MQKVVGSSPIIRFEGSPAEAGFFLNRLFLVFPACSIWKGFLKNADPSGNNGSAMAGNPIKLVAAHPGNTNAVKSGIYSESGRVLAPRAREIAEQLMTLPHVSGVDVLAAEEIGSILAALEAIDQDLAK